MVRADWVRTTLKRHGDAGEKASVNPQVFLVECKQKLKLVYVRDGFVQSRDALIAFQLTELSLETLICDLPFDSFYL